MHSNRFKRLLSIENNEVLSNENIFISIEWMNEWIEEDAHTPTTSYYDNQIT